MLSTGPATSVQIHFDGTLVARPIDRMILVERWRRAGFGGGLIVGAIALVTRVLTDPWAAPHAWQVLLAAWLLAISAALIGGLVARSTSRHHVGRAHDTMLKASLVLPAVGLSLILPLTLHAPFALLIDGARAFDSWSALSMAIVGHAHIALAVLSARRALDLVNGSGQKSLGTIYLAVVIVSAVPFGVLYAFPPIFVAITGLPVVAILGYFDPIVMRERIALAD